MWIYGEVKNIREWRGNWYITLVEPEGDGYDIALDVSCNPKRRLIVQNQLAEAGISLGAGMQVRVLGQVSLGRLGKLQVELQQLDTSALIGEVALEKQRLLQALQRDGVIDNNRRIPLPAVPLRIGLVGSDGSDGVKDFLGRLQQSPFAFSVTMRHSPVQGPAAVPALTQAVNALQSEDIEVLVIVRGGGGELDAFDKEPVVRAIAQSRHPVWVGVGHTADQSVADRVAHGSFVTPTACGDALVERVGAYRRAVVQCLQHVSRVAQHETVRSHQYLLHLTDRLDRHANSWAIVHQAQLLELLRHAHRSGAHVLERAHARLLASLDACESASARHVRAVSGDLSLHRQALRLLDPQRQLERGYAIVRDPQGNALRDVAQLHPSDAVQVMLGRGSFGATVTHVQAEKQS